MNNNFKTIAGKEVNLTDYIENYKKEYPDCKVIIGTDSIEKTKFGSYHISYVTCVCLNNGMRGGYHIISKRDFWNGKKKKSLFERLWHEVELTAECAKLVDSIGISPEVHLESNIVYQAAKGYITSLGFTVKCKPDSPVATHAADHAVRGKNWY